MLYNPGGIILSNIQQTALKISNCSISGYLAEIEIFRGAHGKGGAPLL